MAKEEYLSRTRLVAACRKIEAALRSDKYTEADVLNYVAKLNKRAAIEHKDATTPACMTDKGKRIIEEIKEWFDENDGEGSTFRELQEVIDENVTLPFLKQVVNTSPQFETRDRMDRKKYYGHYPKGVFYVLEVEG